MKLKTLLLILLCVLISPVSFAKVEHYNIDSKGAHAFIQFKISHLGFSWIYGRFNHFEGDFSFDRDNISASTVQVKIKTDSVDTNHAERDKHIRGEDFLHVKKFPQASFVSKRITHNGQQNGQIIGDLTLHGVTKEIVIEAKPIGEGNDPWGGFRAGFEGTTAINPADFGIVSDFLPTVIEFNLVVEGIRQ